MMKGQWRRNQLSLTWQLRRVNDCLIGRLRSSRGIQLSVLLAWSMTTLARDAEHVISSTIFVSDARVCDGVKRRRVTFETTWNHRPAEIERPVAVAGAVDPARDLRPVGNG